MGGKTIIIAENISKRFNGIKAVDRVGLRIMEGEIFGLLGPNGAGKTTLISILSTLVKLDSGRALLNGFDVSKDAGRVRESIGMVFQESILDLDLTAHDNLDFHARLYGLKKQLREERIREVVKLVGLEKDLHRKVASFSGGMKRRLEIGRGMLHHPKVLFLDEPTLGLDPQTRKKVLDYVKRLKQKEKVTVLLTTHYIEEADYLCDNIAIIDHGRIIASGSPSELKKKAGSRHKPTLEDVFLKYTGTEIRDEIK
jgi:ABC-2 type transport system ATP-binding protein